MLVAERSGLTGSEPGRSGRRLSLRSATSRTRPNRPATCALAGGRPESRRPVLGVEAGLSTCLVLLRFGRVPGLRSLAARASFSFRLFTIQYAYV